MSVNSLASGIVTAASGAYAAASGWTTPEGLSAFVTSLVGMGALIWSIYSARERKKGLDAAAAEELRRVIREEMERDGSQ